MDAESRDADRRARLAQRRADQHERKRLLTEERLARRLAQTRPTPEELKTLIASRPIPADPADIGGFAFKCLSQHREAGIVYELLRGAGFPTRVCVEIGCGANGGNSGMLACLGYRSLMIDGDQDLVEIADSLFSGLDVTMLHAWVTRETINETLEEHGFTGEVDYLGIDLDGVDYWIWSAMRAVRPLLVVCEFNRFFGPTVSATVPYATDFDRKAPGVPKAYFGASLAGLSSLGSRLGYRLVATHYDNAFFLREGVRPELRAISPAEGWTLRTKGNSADRYERMQKTGVFQHFEQEGYPLVDLTKANEPRR